MADIDILCAIDAETIMEQHPNGGGSTADSAVYAGNENIYMVVKSGEAISGQAGAELNVRASIGDNVRWREVSLSVNFDYGVVFAAFTTSTQLIQVPPSLIGGVAGSTVYHILTPMPVQTSPPNTPPWSATSKDAPYHFWQSTVMATGSVTYHWVFQIFDDRGNSKGYFKWDPFITISDR